ncbi:SMP-30/gluconolaconase/LRE-like protein [Archangium gephyra]|uniref:SMP-30/gluconolaconase/LRE-like protein n=1 Tax=Archangium gephyra TaxID=48 RepID=A0ABX9JQW5_9BACT|nr:SMP-30/gluconolactonase/LRE family protein [Archangium gephyra]REG24627.1 SMP-30/gluconolaconase/LRE-like protein [Archangium gephyra]
MKKNRPLITVFAVTALGFAACDKAEEEKPSRAPPEGTYTVGPRVESVARGFDGHYFVSIQETNVASAEDGTLKRVHENGEVSVFASGMREPRGLDFTGTELVVTDLDRIWAVDKDGNKRVVADSTRFPVTVSNLNDLSVEPGGKTLLVTEMGPSSQMRPAGSTNTLLPVNSAEAQAMPQTARVFRVDVADGTVTPVLEASTDNRILNGVFASKSGRILIADYFGGDLTELANNQQRTLAVPRGVDGIGEDKSGNLYLGVFEEGRVYRTDSNGGNPTVVVEGLGFRGVADIFVDADKGLLLTPNLGAGTLIVQKLP